MAVAIPAQAMVLAFRPQLPGQLRRDHRLGDGISSCRHLLGGNQPQDVAGACGGSKYGTFRKYELPSRFGVLIIRILLLFGSTIFGSPHIPQDSKYTSSTYFGV